MRLNPMERLTSQETNAWSCPFALANPSTKRFACVMKKSDNTCFVEYSSEQAEELSVKYLSSKQKKFRVVGVAMNNAPDDVKKTASAITDDNNHDGIYKFLQKIKLVD